MNRTWQYVWDGCWLILGLAWLAMAPGARADANADVRFKGAGKADPIRIANVTCKPSDIKGAGTVTFDLAWDHSWRAAWEEPEARHGGEGTLKVENWDAAWVFVKFRKPGADGFSHATLSTNFADHAVPAGVKLDVGLTDDPSTGLGAGGQRGVGVFVYRSAPGSGTNNWKGLKLRWLCGADGVPNLDKVLIDEDRAVQVQPAKVPSIEEPVTAGEDDIDRAMNAVDRAAEAVVRRAADVELRVCAIPMVYVPECAFWVGDGATNGIAAQFAAGASTDPFRIGSEDGFTLGGTSARNLGNHDGVGMSRAEDFTSGLTQSLPARFPKGYAAFYCMKRNITRGEYASFVGTLGAGQRGDLYAGVQPGDAPDAECGEMMWGECAAYAAWAGLRPMTELEYEKACRGPLRPAPDEQAVYWGIMDLCGKMTDYVVLVGNQAGRLFMGTHGNGTVALPAGWPFPDSGCGFGFGIRGGCTSDRSSANTSVVIQARLTKNARQAQAQRSFRCVRTANTVRAPLPENDAVAQNLFNDRLRIGNLTVAPSDSKTATVRFDIAWDESWRNATNHDAAWVFFKARARNGSNGQHVKLVADKILNPTGYGQENGTKLEFLVPDGADGFTGVFVRRAANGSGAVAAKGVSVLCSLENNVGDKDVEMDAFGIEMVYVPEGPFYLGSGGTEPNHFYKYTDGSQDNLPYRVLDSGAVPTGPQQDRLWATGGVPDGSDAGEIPAAFPNGYAAFYCMKFAVTHSQYAGFRCALDPTRLYECLYDMPGPGFTTLVKRYNKTGNWSRCDLQWPDGAAFGAWAGLRPMTELEFEKACRGPRAPVPNEARPSYWGIRDLTVGGAYTRAVTIANIVGRGFKGSHGQGTPTLPADWPREDGVGARICGGGWSVGQIFVDSDHVMTSDRSGRAGAEYEGWRGVRSAPVEAVAVAKPRDNSLVLELDPIPDLREADVGIFHLSGRVRNASDKALKVELTSPLPDVCFPACAEPGAAGRPAGAGSRVFTAAPKADTPFRILTVLTLSTARAVRRGQAVAIRVGVPGGEVLAETGVGLPLADPLASSAPVIGMLDGGAVSLRLTNATDRPQTVALELAPPAAINMPEAQRRLEIPPGRRVVASFPVLRQAGIPGFYRLPYRVTVATGAPQDGAIIAELRPQSRWLVAQRRLQTGPTPGAPVDAETADKDGMDDLIEELDAGAPNADNPSAEDPNWAVPADLFTAAKPPGSWRPVTHGASLWLSKLKPPPTAGALVLAATRVTAPAAREVVVRVGCENARIVWLDKTALENVDWGVGVDSSYFTGRVLVNGEIAYDSRPGAKDVPRPVRLRKGENTLLVQCDAAASGLGNIFALFYDAKGGSRLDGMVLDVEAKQ